MRKILAFILAISIVLGLSVNAFAATGHSDEARAVLALVNERRAAEGLGALTWDSGLVSYATTRAKEIVKKWSHTRPNGEDSLDYPRANGENLAYGDIFTADDVVDGWMGSTDHRENILYPHFTSLAVACWEDDDGQYYWVQIFHSDKKVTTDGKIVESGDVNAAVSAATVTAALDKAYAASTTTVSAIVKDKTSISAAAIKAMADWGVKKGRSTALIARTSFSDSAKIQGQLTINPASFTKLEKEFKLGVYVENSDVSAIRAKMNKWYSNSLVVVQLEQTGALGGTVKVAAKADIAKLDEKNLVFYAYDKAANKITRIEKPAYTVDKSGFLHFSTSHGGYIIVTDQPLTKR